jgi:Fe-S cluster assembly protein SufD
LANDILNKEDKLSFRENREKAWNHYINSPLPDRASHLWRYSNPNDFLSVIPESNLKEIKQTDLVNSELAAKGVIYSYLKTAIANNPDLVQKYLGKLISPEFGKFESFNTALWDNGYFLFVPDNTTIDEPFIINHEFGKFQRLLVVIGDNSNVTIIDNYSISGSEEHILLNNAIEIFAGDSSNVKYLNIQNLGNNLKSYLSSRTEIGRDSVFSAVYGGFGGSKIKADTGVILSGRGANSNVAGVIFADSNQHMDFHTRHHHKASESYSNLDFKVVLKDKANSAYTGLIRVEKDAVNCEAYQENRNLLLNKGTKAESIPELEILTDQVRCTHGATMGPIDPETIFYLQSRGFNEAEAVGSVVSGFIEATLKNAPDEFKTRISELVLRKLNANE